MDVLEDDDATEVLVAFGSAGTDFDLAADLMAIGHVGVKRPAMQIVSKRKRRASLSWDEV